ncbi:MAG: sulfite exporter TauE/SafE family protein [Humidesulfovibrio sp.]|nr:sulfite exporter TauE/SafE family protein [Humidesulfovibrio sp.]
MGVCRELYELMKQGAIAQAKWDMEMSMSILHNRKKLLLLALMVVPILVINYAFASDFIGSKHAYGPAFYSDTIFLVSIGVGLAAGLITGCIGAGGGFIITPALMAAGVKGILAVGTDMFHIFAKAIMGTAVHKKLGNVSVKLAVWFVIGSTGGTFIGGYVNNALYRKDPLLSDMFISIVYAGILGFLGFYALFDFLGASRASKKPGAVGGDAHGGPATTTGMATKLQNMKFGPMITFDEDFVPGGKQIAGVIVLLGGVIVGTLATLMGAGGGFVTFPMFVYIFGVSSMTTVGTDILQIIFTAGIGSIAQYAIYGFVFYSLAMGMLLGSLLGIQIGALTTKVVKGIHIRGFYAISILAGFINRIATLPKKFVELGYVSLSKDVINGIETVGNWLFWAVVIYFGVWVFFKFFTNIGKLRGEA